MRFVPLSQILVENRNKDGGAPHVEFAKALKELYTKGLREYVKKYHLQGPSWSASGSDARGFPGCPCHVSCQGAPAPPSQRTPPPLRAGPPALKPATGGSSAPDMAKVFSQLNQGEAATAGTEQLLACFALNCGF